jgi:hypothetical protein
MVVKLVVRLDLNDMSSIVLYPRDEEKEERVALLSGIVQLVSAALDRSEESYATGTPNFMKSDKGVVGYVAKDDSVLICDGDSEGETGDLLKSIIKSSYSNDDELVQYIERLLRKRGKEISSLWGGGN